MIVSSSINAEQYNAIKSFGEIDQIKFAVSIELITNLMYWNHKFLLLFSTNESSINWARKTNFDSSLKFHVFFTVMLIKNHVVCVL